MCQLTDDEKRDVRELLRLWSGTYRAQHVETELRFLRRDIDRPEWPGDDIMRRLLRDPTLHSAITVAIATAPLDHDDSSLTPAMRVAAVLGIEW